MHRKPVAALSAALKNVEPRVFEGALYRFIGSRFIDSPLSSAGSIVHGGRFNLPGAFEVLYTALDPDTALAEREGILLTAAGIKAAAGVRTGILLRIECRLTQVLDLTDADRLERLGVPLAELLGPWLPWNVPAAATGEMRPAPSQRLGFAVHRSRRFEGILAPSAKDAGGRCLAIFPARLRPESSLQVDDPKGIIRAALGLARLRSRE